MFGSEDFDVPRVVIATDTWDLGGAQNRVYPDADEQR